MVRAELTSNRTASIDTNQGRRNGAALRGHFPPDLWKGEQREYRKVGNTE